MWSSHEGKGDNSHYLRLVNLCYLSLSLSCGMNSLRTSQLGWGRWMCSLSSPHPNLRDWCNVCDYFGHSLVFWPNGYSIPFYIQELPKYREAQQYIRDEKKYRNVAISSSWRLSWINSCSLASINFYFTYFNFSKFHIYFFMRRHKMRVYWPL